jgi:hypothetical protein
MTPAHRRAEAVVETRQGISVHGIALGASGQTLAQGLEQVRAFVRSEIY